MRAVAALGGFLMMAFAGAVDPKDFPADPKFPDLLTMQNGMKVTTKSEWETQRKPELKKQFQDLMYGQYPSIKPDVSAKVVYENKTAFGGKATLREVALKVTPDAPAVYVLIVTPNHRSNPVPAFVGLSFGGNHNLVEDAKIRIPEGWMYPGEPGVVNNQATAAGRGKSRATWPLEQIVDRGYALAVAYNGDIIPDNPKIRGGLADLLLPATAKDDPAATATIMAWAWGMHRIADYVTTLPEIDAKRLAVVGHSRLGKTAILAAAFDERFSIAIPNNAGCGGTAPNPYQGSTRLFHTGSTETTRSSTRLLIACRSISMPSWPSVLRGRSCSRMRPKTSGRIHQASSKS
jgi:hypothetical protein